VVTAVVAVVVVALLGIWLATRNSTSTGSPAASSSSSTTAARSGSTPTSAVAKKPAASSSAASSPATAAAGTAPYTDPQTGFTITAPKNWAVHTDGTLTDFRDPDTGAYLRVDHVQPPGPSPEGAWYDLEQSFAATNANYQRIRIDPTTYSGYRAAVWEFTYSAGGADLHVADLGFITPHYGFALYFQTRAADWDRLQPTLQAFKDSFKAPA
jgi:hypothetical protein